MHITDLIDLAEYWEQKKILQKHRLALAYATMIVIKNGLSIFGVSAPEQNVNQSAIAIEAA